MRTVRVELDSIWYATDRVAACLIVRTTGTADRIVPVWTTADIAARVESRRSYSPVTPDPMDVLAEVVEDEGIRNLRIDSYYRGRFTGTIELGGGESADADELAERAVDCRVSDLLILAHITGKPVEIRQDVLEEVGFFVPAGTDVAEILNGEADLPFVGADVSAPIDVSDDEEFLRLMRDLGLEDNDT